MTRTSQLPRTPHRRRSLIVILAIVGFSILGTAVLEQVLPSDRRCSRFGREHRVSTRAVSLNEWGSCQYLDGRTWRSVHTGKAMKWLTWSSR